MTATGGKKGKEVGTERGRETNSEYFPFVVFFLFLLEVLTPDDEG